MATPLPTLAELGACTFAKPSSAHGYADGKYKNKQMPAHRAIWLTLHGDIPKGMVIDHVCHSVAAKEQMCYGGTKCIHRSCVNPDHLQLVTHKENMSRGSKKLNNRKSCKNGHPMIEENIGVRKRKDGSYSHQFCILCTRDSSRKSMTKLRAKKKAQGI